MARTEFVPGEPGVDAYRVMTALVVPRPIAWVSTRSADGVDNLAPFSFFTVASGTPPMVLFVSVGRTDTLDNAVATGEFVVNVASEQAADLVNATSGHYAADTSEAEALGVRLEDCVAVRPRRVADSPASMECRLASTQPMGDSTIVVGEVLRMSVRDDVLDGEHPVFDRLAAVSRLGDDEWGRPPQVVRRDRPD